MTARAEAATEHHAAGVVHGLVRRVISALVIATILTSCGYHDVPEGATLEASPALVEAPVPVEAPVLAEPPAPTEPPMPSGPPMSTEPLTLVEHAAFGAFTYGGVWQGMEPVVRLEADLGRRLDVVHWFMNWDHAFDPRMVEAVEAGGRAPLISWQPMRQDVADIAAGRYDDYIRSWARGVRASPGLVYLRPFPEMNGDWVPWNGDPDALRSAWVRMTGVFAAEGAGNVRWVWSPNVTDGPRSDDNRMELYYPGDDHVDVLGLSGYNWGETRPYHRLALLRDRVRLRLRAHHRDRSAAALADRDGQQRRRRRQGRLGARHVRVHRFPAHLGAGLVRRAQGGRLAPPFGARGGGGVPGGARRRTDGGRRALSRRHRRDALLDAPDPGMVGVAPCPTRGRSAVGS
jgi:hypothetical protein